MLEGLFVEYTQNQTVTNIIYTGRSRGINVSRSKVTASLDGTGWIVCRICTEDKTLSRDVANTMQTPSNNVH